MDQKTIWDNRFSNSNSHPRNNEWIEKYLEYFNKKMECMIVDLGCGKGANAIYLQEQGFNVLACDFAPSAIRFINEIYPSIQTICFDMISEFPNDISDVGIVLASLSIHYFALDDTVKLYDNIRNILGLGGYFIFRVNSKKEFENKDKVNVTDIIEKDYYILKDGTTKRYFDIKSISQLLNNFSIVKISEDNSRYHGREKYYIEGVVQKI